MNARVVVLAALAAAGLVGAVLAVGATASSEAPPASSEDPASPSPAAASPEAADGGVLAGLCEASAIVPGPDGWLVGDNETENLLHGFDRELRRTDGVVLADVVEDVEALAVLPDGALVVVGSQGANKSGKRKPLRERVLVVGGTPVGPDLSGCPACVAAKDRPPKEGGLSVEGAAWWRDSLWLGVRSPLAGGDAMLLRMAGDPRVALSVAEVREVDLGGLGVRDLVVKDGALWILAGPATAAEAPHRLARLDAPDAAPVFSPVVLPSGAEGVAFEGPDRVLVVVDGDGEPGRPCKTPARWARVALPP